MKSRDVFLAAAAYIASGQNKGFGACRAIAKVQQALSYSTRSHNAFARVFPWHTDEACFCIESNADEIRILALCLMAAMCNGETR